MPLNEPESSLVRSQNGEKWNYSSLGGNNASASNPASTSAPNSQPASSTPSNSAAPATSSSSSNASLSVAKLNVNNGRLTVSRAGSAEKPRVYDKVVIEMSNFSFTTSFPFSMTARLPGDGTLKIDGKAGPIDPNDAAKTPLEAKVSVLKMNLAESGFIDPAAGISGIADFDGTVQSDGHEAKTSGTLKGEKLQLVQKGSPAGKPLQVQYAVTHDLVKQTGTLTQGEIMIGKAVAHLSGTYDAHGTTTTVNLKLEGQGLPVDDLEAELPAVGVILPSGSQLKGGTMAANFTISGPVDKLVTVGTVHLENSALAGFNLGSKLSSISALSGKSGTQQ